MTEPVSTELVTAGEFPLWNPDMDFRKLALDTAYVAQGFRLIDKNDLVGVPFVIKRVVYREGFPRQGAEGDYVSVECIVADKATLELEPVKAQLPDHLAVFPNEGVVFNDSGTGVRRNLTGFFEREGLIHCGPVKDGDVPWDRPFQLWADGAGMAQAGITGADLSDPKSAIYLATRGLRKSEYEYMGNPAETFYFG